MSKKQDAVFFNNFIECAACACDAAALLKEIVNDFDPTMVEEYMSRMHSIENDADQKKHALTALLTKTFITPIDREDIVQVSRYIDELTDKVEDVLIRIYCNHITTMNDDIIPIVDTINRCCAEVLEMMQEFPNFKRSKTLNTHFININSLEEEADALYIASMRHLHNSTVETLDVIKWRDIYTYLERCADTAEHIADVVEIVSMKNS